MILFILFCSDFSQLSLYDRKNNQYFSSCPYVAPVKSRKKKIIHRLKQNCIKHSLLCYHVNFIHSWTVAGKKTGKLVFKLSPIDTPNCAGSAHCFVRNTLSGKLPEGYALLTQQ